MDPISAALVGWLVQQAASTGERKLERLLRGDKQANALRTVLTEAIQDAVDEVIVPVDRAVVGDALNREGPGTAEVDIGDVLALREAVLRVISPRLATLADQGYRADADRLADAIAQKIREGIQLNAVQGGPLGPVAGLLRHEQLAGTGNRIADAGERAATASEETARELTEIRHTLRGALSQPRSAPRPGRPVKLDPRPEFLAGREELLAEVYERLGAADAWPGVVALYGLGGAGKTSVALQYAHRHMDEYGLVWQFASEDPAALPVEFADLGRQLGADDRSANPVQRVHEVLRDRQDGWLLVFDNVPGFAEVKDMLPPAGRGHVLITSQDPRWPSARSIEVRVLDQEVAAGFLLARTGAADGAAAYELAQELGGLPLALEQAAAYIVDTGLGLAGYLDMFREERGKLLARGEPVRHDKPVAATLTLAFEQVQQTAKEAGSLLRLLSCCAPDAIPLGLLFQPGMVVLKSVPPEPARELRPLLASRVAVLDAVLALRRYSLIGRPADGVVSVHRLVQAVTLDQLPAGPRGDWRQAAACLIEAALPDDPYLPSGWPRYAALLPHARVALDAGSPGMSKVANYLGHSGSYALAHALCREILDARKRTLGAEHPETLAAQVSLAAWTGQAGDAAQARDRTAELVPIYERVHGPEHPATLTARGNLAYYTGHAGESPRARDQFAELVPILERVLGAEHPETLAARTYLARWTGEAGDPAGARDQYAELLPIVERLHGHENPDTLAARVNLARFIGEAGDPAEARDRLAELVHVRVRVSGHGHPNTLIAWANLARFIGEAGDPGEARDRLAELVPKYERVSGPQHPLTLNARTLLARFIGEAGDAAGARDLFAELAPLRERVSGAAHPETLAAQVSLACWSRKAERRSPPPSM